MRINLTKSVSTSFVECISFAEDKQVEGDRGAGTQENKGGRWAGGDGSRSGSHARAGGGKRMRDTKCFNNFFVPFLSKLTKIRTKEY